MPKFTTHYRRGYKVLEIDTKTAVFKNIPWTQLGGFGKRKFDNWIFLNNLKNQDHYRTKLIYV